MCDYNISKLMINKRNVLIAFLYLSKLLINLISRGSLFQKYGAAAWKDQAPNVFSILSLGS